MNTQTKEAQSVAIRVISNNQQHQTGEVALDCSKRQVTVRHSTKDVFCSVFRDLKAGRLV